MDVVTRDRYALFRATRIFKDLTVMRDVLRVVIHLNRKASAPCFIKVGRSGSRTSHGFAANTSVTRRVPWGARASVGDSFEPSYAQTERSEG